MPFFPHHHSSGHGQNSFVNTMSTDQQEETPWVDAWIRWKDDEGKKNEPVEESAGLTDPFADPDPTSTFEFQFDGISVSLQGYKYESAAVWQSTGLTLWKASEHLCRYLVECPPTPATRVLELGAGLGLCGIVLQQRLPDAYVCITDGDTDVLPHLRQNAKGIECRQLLWGRVTAEQFRQVHGTFDCVIASDILYSPHIVEPLWETIERLLDQAGVFIMAFAKRKVPVQIEDVILAAERVGLTHQLVREQDEVKIIEFRWKE